MDAPRGRRALSRSLALLRTLGEQLIRNRRLHHRLGYSLRRPGVLLAVLAASLIAVPSALTAPVTTQFTGSVSSTGVKFKNHPITVTEAGTITATLEWAT